MQSWIADAAIACEVLPPGPQPEEPWVQLEWKFAEKAAAATGLPFYVCGVPKSTYDLLLWRAFRKTKPPEET